MPRPSAFSELGFKATLEALVSEVKDLYLADEVPWIVGYSGGKDSTATLQVVWLALREIPEAQRRKPVHVISTDTLVENPVVAAWVVRSLDVMRTAAATQHLPIEPHRLTPLTEESFWVNLIGKGYPAPRHKFRWCTERLKIKPSNRFIMDVVTAHKEAVLLLGARKSESQARAKVFERAAKHRVRDRLSPNTTLPGCLVYTPIEEWHSDDVWMFLTQVENPWGHNNKELLGMYGSASADGECPLVVDTSTPSCGDSRFGCWVCTLVEQDKSMSAMIQNSAEMEWMRPLLKLRNALDFRRNKEGELDDDASDHHLRDFRRMSGAVQLMENGAAMPGPYTQESRERWLRLLLEAQMHIRANGPADVRDLELITLDELQEIRRIWVVEKHEIEDRLPRLYFEVTGTPYPGRRLDDSLALQADDLALLKEVCGEDAIHFELARELLSIERQQKSGAGRAGHYGRLEKAFTRHYFKDAADALQLAKRKAAAKAAVVDGTLPDAVTADVQNEPASEAAPWESPK